MAYATLLTLWRSRRGGCVDAVPFLNDLNRTEVASEEKCEVIRTMDDWTVHTNVWYDCARYFGDFERLAADGDFPEHKRAALVASKTYFSTGRYDKALEMALIADELFDLTPRAGSENLMDKLYISKMIEQALDTYKRAQIDGEKPDDRLERLVDRLLERNLSQSPRELRNLIGLALDVRRLDVVRRVVESAGDEASTLLAETVSMVLAGSANYDYKYRARVMAELVRLFSELPNPDFVAIVHCHINQKAPQSVAAMLAQLTANAKDEKSELIAFQIAFDLYENASQEFIRDVSLALDKTPVEAAGSQEQDVAMGEGDEPSTSGPTRSALDRLRDILSGSETIRLHQQFLIRNNKTDMLILKEIRESVRTACTHNGTLLANGLMHLGTTCDDFLRENLEWIGKATNWNKFCAVATLGLIHRGHESAAMRLLDVYLPKPDATADQFGFKEGGALFALGLIHANHSNDTVTSYLRDQLSTAQTAPVRHGAALGLGLTAMGTGDVESFAKLRDALFTDEAVTGEAAGLAMGLVMIGSRSEEAYREMTQYMLDTQHDKIQRGLRTGVALLAYGRADEADSWADNLAQHQHNAVMRQTGVCVLAMAWAGSGNPTVVQRLLNHVAADPSDDVKRMAATAIGFVFSNDPEVCVSYVNMLSSHFNPHVRYGAAMALGIACAGTGYKEAIAVLEPMLSAKENYVRQGAAIALSFVLVQHTEPTCPKVTDFRKQLTKMITEKGEESITKFGACIAQGILDVGGRNMTVSLHSRSGHPDMGAVAGMFIFLQYWTFHPWVPFVSLACRPTSLIALNRRLEMPKVDFRCNAKPSLFAYPPVMEEKKSDNKDKVEVAVLSITNKKKQTIGGKEKDKRKDKEGSAEKTPAKEPQQPEKMAVDEPAPAQDKKEAKEGGKEGATTTAPAQPEPTWHVLSNPARVVRLQLKTLSTVPEGARYRPVKPLTHGGIILVRDRHPDQNEQLVETATAGGTSTAPSGSGRGAEPQPHATFEFDFNTL